MIVSLLVSVSRRIRAWTSRKKQKKDLRMNTGDSVMFIVSKGKTVFKFLNK